ncbi:MAG: hypothetical protein HYY09_06895 [Firmicutes bacterium]|nr:hypothetical protein [Bacillota bacterium]
MCRECGCQVYLEGGRKTALARTVELVRELGVTPENARAFEDGETICGLIGPKLSVEDPEVAEVREIVGFMNRCHAQILGDSHRKGLAAARDVFSKLPAGGSPKEVLKLWHQLEQVSKDLSEEDLASLSDPGMREAIRAVQHIHNDIGRRKKELAQMYGL